MRKRSLWYRGGPWLGLLAIAVLAFGFHSQGAPPELGKTAGADAQLPVSMTDAMAAGERPAAKAVVAAATPILSLAPGLEAATWSSSAEGGEPGDRAVTDCGGTCPVSVSAPNNTWCVDQNCTKFMGAGVACPSANQGHARCFDFTVELVDQPFTVDVVKWGVEMYNDEGAASVPVKINIYTDTECPPSRSRAELIATVDDVISAADSGLVKITQMPLGVVIPVGSVMVVEVELPDGTQAPNEYSAWLYSTTDACVDSYLWAPACGDDDWDPVSGFGFPDSQALISVSGHTAGGDAVVCGDGVIEGCESCENCADVCQEAPYCGDLIVDPNEECDPPGQVSSECTLDDRICRADCTCPALGACCYVGPPGEKEYKIGPNKPFGVPYPSIIRTEIFVPEHGDIVDLDVDMLVSHLFRFDLVITLEHKENQTSVTLVNMPNCGCPNIGNPATGEKVYFDDEAATRFQDYPNPDPVGHFRPLEGQLLSAFDGKDKYGTWSLTVEDIDGSTLDEGVLHQWSLHFINPDTETEKLCTPTWDADECDSMLKGVFHQDATCGDPGFECQSGCVYDNGNLLDDGGRPVSQWDPDPPDNLDPWVIGSADDFYLNDQGASCDIQTLTFWTLHEDEGALSSPVDYLGINVTVYADGGEKGKGPAGQPESDGSHTGNVVYTHLFPQGTYTWEPVTHTTCISDMWLIQLDMISFPMDLPTKTKLWLEIAPVMGPVADFGRVYIGLSQQNYGHPAMQFIPPVPWRATPGNFDDCPPETPPEDSHRSLAFKLGAPIGENVCGDGKLYPGETCEYGDPPGVLCQWSNPDCDRGVCACLGACCDEPVSECDDGILSINCAPGMRFEAKTLCADLDPPCEPPCVDECDPEAENHYAEGEPACGPDYVDTYNGGCDAGLQVFQTIVCGDTVCGESGIFEVAGVPDDGRDTDWYSLEVTESVIKTITWRVKAGFDVTIEIYDSSGGCAGTPLATADAQCDDENNPGIATVTADVSLGTYWLTVRPSDDLDRLPCNAVNRGYTAMLGCMWGLCGNDVVDSGEDCDGTADEACPGECLDDCTCPQACCFWDGSCEYISRTECRVRFGTSQGLGSICDGSCPSPSGANFYDLQSEFDDAIAGVKASKVQWDFNPNDTPVTDMWALNDPVNINGHTGPEGDPWSTSWPPEVDNVSFQSNQGPNPQAPVPNPRGETGLVFANAFEPFTNNILLANYFVDSFDIISGFPLDDNHTAIAMEIVSDDFDEECPLTSVLVTVYDKNEVVQGKWKVDTLLGEKTFLGIIMKGELTIGRVNIFDLGSGGLGCGAEGISWFEVYVPYSNCSAQGDPDGWCDDASDCTVDWCEKAHPDADPVTGCVNEYHVKQFADVIAPFCPPVCDQPGTTDIICISDDFQDGPGVTGCVQSGVPNRDSTDVFPCGGNGIIDLDDLLAVLDAFVGEHPCPDPCP